MTRNLMDVFNQRDEFLRVLAMTEIFETSATFADHDGVVSGIEQISAKVHELHSRTPGFTFAQTSFYELDDLGSLSWSYGPEDGEPAVTGTDTALIANGRITKLYTHLTS